jgi:hypothetical protein
VKAVVTSAHLALFIQLLKSGFRENPLMRSIGIATVAVAALACTSGLTQDLSKYWPANEYLKFTCLELAQEGRAISKRGFIASGLKAGLGGSDATVTAPAIVIVWPTTHVDDEQRSKDLVLATQQMDALEQASVLSQCSIRFQRSPAS